MADQAPGSDGGDKINQAIASAPACTSSKLGGNCPYVIDATELAGVQSAAATINCNKTDVTILLGPSHWTLAGSPGIALSAFGCKLEGLDRTQTILDTSSADANIVEMSAINTTVENVYLGTSRGVTRTGGEAIHANSSDLTIRHVNISKTWKGIVFDRPHTGCLDCSDITTIEAPLGGGGGNWGGPAVQFGPIKGCCINPGFWLNANFTVDGSNIGLLIDSGTTDGAFTASGASCNGPNGGNVTIQNSMRATAPERIHFSNVNLEACGSGIPIHVQAGADITFDGSVVGCAGTICNNILNVNSAVSGFRFIGGRIWNSNQECVKITGSGSGPIDIAYNDIGDCGQQRNNSYDSVNVAAGASGVHIDHNTFRNFYSPRNISHNDITFENGAGDNLSALFNTYGNFANTAISMGATGAHIFWTNANNQFIVPLGSAASPSITTGASGSGMYWNSASPPAIQFSYNGVAGPVVNNAELGLGSDMAVRWYSSADPSGSSADTGLSRSNVDEVACGNGRPSDTSCQFDATALKITSTAFARLGTPANGTIKYCNDCAVANPCADGGTGAIAKRLNGAWVCN